MLLTIIYKIQEDFTNYFENLLQLQQEEFMKIIGIIAVDPKEQRSHAQKKQILKKYPEILTVDIPSYNDDSFTNVVIEGIIRECGKNNAGNAVMKTVKYVTPDPDEFIQGCSDLNEKKIILQFLDEPWLDMDVWFSKKQTAAVAEVYHKAVYKTYDFNDKVDEIRHKSRNVGKETNRKNGTHPGPKKGSYSKITPEVEELLVKILEMAPTFNDNGVTAVSVYKQLGLSEGMYYHYVNVLKGRHPERVIKKK